MTRSIKQPDDWTPDQPHFHTGRELFCRALVSKYQPAVAYGQHLTTSTNKSSLKAMGWRVAQEETVVARVKYLRSEKQRQVDNHTSEELTGDVLAELMAQVSQTFTDAHDASEAVLEGEAVVSRIRRLHATHLNRFARAAPEYDASRQSTDLVETLTAPHWCDCEAK